jgi:hypothetical protein
MQSKAIAALAALAVAAAANADTVKLKYVGSGEGRSVRTVIGGNGMNVFAGQLNHQFSQGTGVAAGLTGTLITFCTDLTEYVSSGGSTYTVAPISSLPQTNGWPAMGAVRAQGVYNIYAAAAGQQYGSSDDFAAAFQVALWELVYDFDGTAGSLNLAAGNLKVTKTDGSNLSSGVMTNVNALFAAAFGAPVVQAGLMGLTNDGCQDQIVQVVPLPAAAWIGLAGLAVAFRAGRRRLS